MKVENRNIKYPRIEYRTGELHFILPEGMDYNSLHQKYSRWIKVKQREIETALNNAEDIVLISRNEEELKSFVANTIKEYSEEYGLLVGRTIFRNMKSKWGSCSLHGNLTFNITLKHLPEYYLRYIVFHEMMHMIERKHSKKFWQLISEKFPEYENIELDLFAYWFAINNKSEVIK